MNLNDLRKNAYGNSGVGGNDAGNVNRNMSKSENDENSKINAAFMAQADQIKKEGLLKVGAGASAKKDTSKQKDSVYRRVAKFLLIIGVDEAAKILPHLTESQTEKIVPEIASIRNIEPEEVTEILEEFQGLLQKARESGGISTAREILAKAYGTQKAEEVIEAAVPYPEGKPFDYLSESTCDRILELLGDESDEVRALVLSRLEPKKAAGVINLMEADDKKRIVLRLAKMQVVSPEVIRRVDKAMHEKSVRQASVKSDNLDGRNALAEILRKMPEKAENEILTALSYSDAELSDDLRSRLFTIDDVQNADDRFIQEKLRAMTENEIAYLIAAKADSFRFKILKNVSTGRGDMILEQEQLLKPMRRSDCEAVTQAFFSELRQAYEEGKLRISGRDEEEYVN